MEKSYYFDSHDGKKIFVREWIPAGQPTCIVQIFHGMAEHGGRYVGLAEYLNGLGCLVFADDHRAHGNTDKHTLGYCNGDVWKDTLKDEELLNKKYRNAFDGLPYVILGHSYGSFLLQAYIESVDGSLYDGVVLSGSAKMEGAQVTFGKIVATLGNEKKPANFIKKVSFDAYNKKFSDGTFITSKRDEDECYAADEYCGFVCSNNFYKNFFGGLKGLYKAENLAKIPKNKPIYIYGGDKDPVGDFGKSLRALYETYLDAGLADVKFKLYEGCRHEVINDVLAHECLRDLGVFLSSVKRGNK